MDRPSGPTRVLFVLSAARSGSTWLNAVLGSTSWAESLGEYVRFFQPGDRPTCQLCDADGLAECSVLHGIERVAPADAFRFAAERLGTRVLVDASKTVAWTQAFLGRDDIEARLIHLVRNPCGYLESVMRRKPDAPPERILAQWEGTNRRLAEFLEQSGAPGATVCYDDLADDPGRHFPALCALAGEAWEPQALRYWLAPHHGLAGNGAASLYLAGRAQVRFVTGDAEYYGDLAGRPVSADRRWIERLPPGLIDLALSSPYARALERRLGTRWDPPAP